MHRRDWSKENDIEFMRATLIAQQGSITILNDQLRFAREELERLSAKLVELQSRDDKKYLFEIEELQRRIAKLNKLLFAPKSEKLRDEHKADDEKSSKPRGQAKRLDRSDLIRLDRTIRLDAADCVCGQCGSELLEWEGQFETSEEVHRIPEQFVVVANHRQKYRCTCGCTVETAPMPDKLHPRAAYSIGFAVDTAADKYEMHLPLERQARELERQGLKIDSQTLFDLLFSLCQATKGSLDALKVHVRSQAVLGADETRWPVHGQPTKASTWHAWVLGGPDAVVYEIFDGRGLVEAKKLVGTFAGTLVVDRLKAYRDLSTERPDIELAFCWSHIRREFLDLGNSFARESDDALFWIRWIFRVESYAKKNKLTDDERLRLRDTFSRVAVAQVRELLANAAKTHSPDTPIVKLHVSLLTAWPALERFLSKARIPPHNNASENRLRGLVVGRKNHFGSRSKRGTEVAAQLYSLIESSKLVGVSPREFLRLAVLAPRRGLPPPIPIDLVDPERRRTYEALIEEIAHDRRQDLIDLAAAIAKPALDLESVGNS